MNEKNNLAQYLKALESGWTPRYSFSLQVFTKMHAAYIMRILYPTKKLRHELNEDRSAICFYNLTRIGSKPIWERKGLYSDGQLDIYADGPTYEKIKPDFEFLEEFRHTWNLVHGPRPESDYIVGTECFASVKSPLEYYEDMDQVRQAILEERITIGLPKDYLSCVCINGHFHYIVKKE